MRAILLANATVTSLTGRRCRISLSQGPSALCQPSARPSIDVAPSTSSLRISLLPAFDPPQAGLAPGRVLPRHQAKPGGELPRRLEQADIDPRRRDQRGGDRPDPGDRRQTPRRRIVARVLDDRGFARLDAFGQLAKALARL